MRRAAARRKALAKDAQASVTFASLSDLYSLGRHAGVPASMRGEQLQHTVLHYIVHLDDWWSSTMPEPPFVRLGKVGELPSVNEAAAAEAEEGPAVQSRRHEGDTPSVCMTACVAEPGIGVRPEQVARYELYMEAIEYLDALLVQYDDKKKVCALSPNQTGSCVALTKNLHASPLS